MIIKVENWWLTIFVACNW